MKCYIYCIIMVPLQLREGFLFQNELPLLFLKMIICFYQSSLYLMWWTLKTLTLSFSKWSKYSLKTRSWEAFPNVDTGNGTFIFLCYCLDALGPSDSSRLIHFPHYTVFYIKQGGINDLCVWARQWYSLPLYW